MKSGLQSDTYIKACKLDKLKPGFSELENENENEANTLVRTYFCYLILFS
jgi:hypothetical protein